MVKVRELLEAARGQSGLDDFGEDSFREALEKLVNSVNVEGKLSEFGEMAFRGRIVGYLVTRLEIEHWYREHPEIDDEQIVAPLFGLGLPRTGSTALHCLLARDPATRTLRIWEAEKPCPPPEKATEHTDPRIAEAKVRLAELHRLAPEIYMMIPQEGVEDPTECHDVTGLSFRTYAYEASADCPSYIEWMHSADSVPAYQYHKRVLKLLQWRCPPKRWVLKSPIHMFQIEALDKIYPDARFVTTHRDAADCVPSFAALVYPLGKMVSDSLDPHYVGRRAARSWEIALRRLIAFRDRVGDTRFYDIGFREILSDSIPAIRGLYQWIGWRFTPAAESGMLAWREANPKGKHGEYTVRPADWGLDSDVLREQFGFYHKRYPDLIRHSEEAEKLPG